VRAIVGLITHASRLLTATARLLFLKTRKPTCHRRLYATVCGSLAVFKFTGARITVSSETLAFRPPRTRTLALRLSFYTEIPLSTSRQCARSLGDVTGRPHVRPGLELRVSVGWNPTDKQKGSGGIQGRETFRSPHRPRSCGRHH